MAYGQARGNLAGAGLALLCRCRRGTACKKSRHHNQACEEDYLSHISDAYCVADLVIARSGAMTIAEIAACALPAILVPYPHAVRDHQLINAQNLVERGAAAMIPDEELGGERLAREIRALMQDRGRLKSMARNARSFGRIDAAEKIARSVERYAGAPATGAEPG